MVTRGFTTRKALTCTAHGQLRLFGGAHNKPFKADQSQKRNLIWLNKAYNLFIFKDLITNMRYANWSSQRHCSRQTPSVTYCGCSWNCIQQRHEVRLALQEREAPLHLGQVESAELGRSSAPERVEAYSRLRRSTWAFLNRSYDDWLSPTGNTEMIVINYIWGVPLQSYSFEIQLIA